jgi:hypothetical protein
MQFLETLLLPEVHEPHPFVFFKVINVDENPFADDLPIKSITLTLKKKYSPVIAKVASIDIFDDELMFTVKSDDKPTLYSVSTRNYYIMENDEIEGDPNINVEIGDDAENKLIQAMIRDPSIFKKIPQKLKDHKSFKRKVDLERTKRKVRVLDTIGDRTGAIHIPGKLPHEMSRIINGYLDTEDIDEKQLNEEKERKTRRLAPQENARSDGYFSRFSRMFGKGTRKNKKKRYGRV